MRRRAYPRTIDFERFRIIADEVGAFLLADISHIAGLIVAGAHPSPIDHAHFTTTSTYKQLYGPRGGLILMGRDHNQPYINGKGTLSQLVQRAVFPFFQGTPNLSAIAAKARALDLVVAPNFIELAKQIIDNAQTLSGILIQLGYRVITGGTDNHIILFDVISKGITGTIAEQALEECNIVVNKNSIPGDKKSPFITSGVRLGTNSLTARGMGKKELSHCAALIHNVLSSITVISDKQYVLDKNTKISVTEEVQQLCDRFPIPRYGG